jgi:myo-inositol 2-dehydrogenase/D-chiro-inositol 1-dehydrogenase
MRIGVAGVGRIGAMHAANLASLDTVEEVLLFDPVAGRAGPVAAALGERARAVDELDVLLAASDGVLLATPTSTHAQLLRRCVVAGVSTLCEKPIATSLGDMRALVADIEAAGVEVLVGFQRRFDPAIVELHRRLRAGEVGVVYLLRALGYDASPPDAGYLPTSGGIFRDLLIHDLDVVPWLLGEPVVTVFASGSVLVDEAFAAADDVDNAVAVLCFASGAHAVLTGGRHDALGYDHRIEVFGSLDSLTVGLDHRTPLSSLEPGGNTVAAEAYPGFPERFCSAYRNEIAVFIEVLAGRASNPSPARDSLVSLELAEACETSRRTGCPVRPQSATAAAR